MKLTDAQAKQVMRQSWPLHTKTWSPSGSSVHWLRAQPATPGQGVASPRLLAPGSSAFATQPDGLYVSTGLVLGNATALPEYADVIAIEVCGGSQNFNDKRARYSAMTQSRMVELRRQWLRTLVTVQAGAQRARSERLGIPDSLLDREERLLLPVRVLRVLYCLHNDPPDDGHYGQVRGQVILEGHEYIAPHSDLSQWTSQQFQEFVKGMAGSKHWSR